jgi:hypothetical protein
VSKLLTNLLSIPRASRWIVLALAIFFSGCGLKEYEAKMQLQQARIKYTDEENKNLEPYPVTLPDAKVSGWELVPDDDFFFRPPKGLPTEADQDEKGRIRSVGGLLFRYSGEGKGIDRVYILAVQAEDSDKFEKAVLRALKMAPNLPVKIKDVAPMTGPKMEYRYFEDPSKGNQRVYFYTDGSYQIALGFRPTEASEETGIDTVIDFSLASMAVGDAGSERKRTWKAPKAGK